MWNRDNTAVLTPDELVEASERGRLMAAVNITRNPDARYRVESVYGKKFCMERWPEAYGHPNSGGYMKAFQRAVQAAKSLLPILLIALLVTVTAYPQATFRAPTISAGSNVNYVYWTAGKIHNGGHEVSVAAGSHILTTSQADCSAPGYAACNFLYANNAGAVDITNTLATAVGSGNTLLAFIETGAADTILAHIALPSQSGTMWNQAGGPILSGFTAITPAAAAGTTVGSGALPFSGAYLGTAATNNILFAPIATAAARTFKFSDPGAAGAFAFADPSVTTKQLVFDLSGATGASTLASTLLAGRTITLTDPGAATAALAFSNIAQTFTGVQSFTSPVLTTPTVTTDIHSTVAAGAAIGTAALPFGSLVLGTAATNVFTFTPSALGAARAITIADPGGAATVAFTNSTSSQAMTGLGHLSPHTAATSNLGTALLPWGTAYIGTAATNNFVLTPAATGAARVITFADPGGAATLAYTNSTTSQALTGLGHLSPHTAATSNLGTALLPWGVAYLGTAATNNFVITPAATAAARVITMADPGGAATIAYSNPTTAQTITNTTLTTPTLTTPIYSGETALCSAQFNATNGDTGTTLTNVTGMVVTVVPGTYRFRINVPGVSTTNSGIKVAFKYTTTVISNMEATGWGYSAAALEVAHTTSTADQATLFADNTLAYISVVVEGVVVVGTGGTIQFQAAQNAAHADTTSVYARASMAFTRLN